MSRNAERLFVFSGKTINFKNIMIIKRMDRKKWKRN
jgi:hypothetical protein